MVRQRKLLSSKYILEILSALLIFCVMTVMVCTNVKAETQNSGSDGKVYVIDDAGKLSDSEEQNLQKLCKQKSDNCQVDFVVMTSNTGLDGSELDRYVRDILEQKYGYNGSGSNCDAACYVIDFKSRADRIITSGNAKSNKKLTQSKLQNIVDSTEKNLKDAHYYQASVKYLNGMEKYLNNSIVYRLTLYWGIKLLIAAGIAIVAVLVMMFHAKSKMTVSGVTYAKGHHGNLVGKQDLFINTTVVRRKIETNHGNGGGGGNSGSAGGHF